MENIFLPQVPDPISMPTLDKTKPTDRYIAFLSGIELSETTSGTFGPSSAPHIVVETINKRLSLKSLFSFFEK